MMAGAGFAAIVTSLSHHNTGRQRAHAAFKSRGGGTPLASFGGSWIATALTYLSSHEAEQTNNTR